MTMRDAFSMIDAALAACLLALLALSWLPR